MKAKAVRHGRKYFFPESRQTIRSFQASFPRSFETGKPSDTFGIRSTDENPANSSFNDSDTGPDSVLKKGNPTEVSPTPSLPLSASPQWSQKVAGENELPPAFSDGVGEGSDSSDDTAAKAIGFSDSLPRTTIPSQGLPPQVGFRDNRISSDRNAPDGLKVALSGEGEVVVPPPRSGSTPSVRFFDRMNVGSNRPEGGNAKILGFSDRRPNSRFLRRGTESSSKNVFQPSGKPNDYNSLKNFLSNRNKLDTGGTGGIPSTGNYPEAVKFLESIDSSKSDESSALREDGTLRMMPAIKMPSNGYAQEGRALNCKIEKSGPQKVDCLGIGGPFAFACQSGRPGRP